MVTFLDQNFLLFILFLFSLISFHPCVFFFFLLFLLHTYCPYLYPPSFLSFSPSFKNVPALSSSHSFFFFSPALTLYCHVLCAFNLLNPPFISSTVQFFTVYVFLFFQQLSFFLFFLQLSLSVFFFRRKMQVRRPSGHK